MTIETVVWIVGLVVVCGLLLWLLGKASSGELMRCPVAGSVAFVRAERAEGSGNGLPPIAVTRCNLWPERQGCAQQCLARYGENTTGLRVNLKALRPFEPQ